MGDAARVLSLASSAEGCSSLLFGAASSPAGGGLRMPAFAANSRYRRSGKSRYDCRRATFSWDSRLLYLFRLASIPSVGLRVLSVPAPDGAPSGTSYKPLASDIVELDMDGVAERTRRRTRPRCSSASFSRPNTCSILGPAVSRTWFSCGVLAEKASLCDLFAIADLEVELVDEDGVIGLRARRITNERCGIFGAKG